jgi:outer membrane protein
MRTWTIAVLLLLAAALLPAEQEITKVGVVDTSRIYSVYFQDSKALRDLAAFKQSILEESTKLRAEITSLQTSKVDAERDGRKDEALRLESRILEKENFLREYQRVKNLEYRSRQSKVELESSFLGELADAIGYVAVSEGFSIILEKQNPIFLYFTPESDITEKVLQHLFEKAGKTYTPGN